MAQPQQIHQKSPTQLIAKSVKGLSENFVAQKCDPMQQVLYAAVVLYAVMCRCSCSRLFNPNEPKQT